MVLVTCETCGKSVNKPKSLIKSHTFCGNDCYHIWRKTTTGSTNPHWKGGNVDTTCRVCGKVFGVAPGQVTKRVYCSVACKATAQRGDFTCDHCGKQFGGQKQRFCSQDCSLAYFREHPRVKTPAMREQMSSARIGTPGLSGPSNPMYRHGKNIIVEKRCLTCQKVFTGPAHIVRCSRACINKDRDKIMHEYWESPEGQQRILDQSNQMTGAGNRNWHHGRSPNAYARGFKQYLKKSIRDRDGNRCRICGKAASVAQPLHVHHYDRSKDNHRPDNLITLCNRCHRQVSLDRLECPTPVAVMPCS